MGIAWDGSMRVTTFAALMVCLAAAGRASAQIPRDPLADGPPAAASSGRGGKQELPAPYVTRQSDVEIPYSVRPGSTPETQPAAVRVFVSWDRGKTWHFYEERRPEDGRFRFRPRQDGEYWFATQTIDRSGRPDGAEPRSPQLRLVIDTQRPQLVVQTQVDASDNVIVTWSAADPNLVPASLKVEYQDASGTGGPWLAVELRSTATATATTQVGGQTTFHPSVTNRLINLRAEILDAAGNAAYFSQRLSLVASKPKAGGGFAADPSATRWPTDNPHVENETTTQVVADGSAAVPQRSTEQVRIPNLVSNPFLGPGRLASAAKAPQPAADELPLPNPSGNSEAYSQRPPPQTVTGGDAFTPVPSRSSQYDLGLSPSGESLPGPRAADAPPSAPANGLAPAADNPSMPPAAYGDASRPTASPPAYESLPFERAPPLPSAARAPTAVPSGGYIDNAPASPAPPPYSRSRFGSNPEVMPAPRPSESVDRPSGQRPRLTNSRRFSLDYDVEAAGPEGLAAVELWGTTDGGRTWVKWGADPDKTSPFDVEVNSEALYGFRIVIVNKNGLATSRPQPGDAADIWVGIDLTRPTARLTGAAYGQGEAAGKLDIRWQASDSNLGSRPVTLGISDRPDGPFTPIAAGLPNTGQYFWEFDPRSPRQIYLRLEVRDDAGNAAIDQLNEPIKVEGLEPKGRIRGFSPGPENLRGAFRPPLFR